MARAHLLAAARLASRRRPPSWAASSLATSATHTDADADAAASAPPAAAPAVVYTAPLSTTVVRLKRLSVASCVLTTAGAPALATLDAAGAAHPAAQAGIAAAVAAFGLFTTGLLHWFTSPYVHRLVVPACASPPSSPSPVVTLETRDFWARRRVEAVPLAALAPPTGTLHPQVTFRVGPRFYYVDTDHFPGGGVEGAAVLRRLVAVREAAAAEDGVEHGGA